MFSSDITTFFKINYHPDDDDEITITFTDIVTVI